MVTEQAVSAEENARIARRFPEEVATAGNLAVIDEICAEDMVDHSPLGVVRGREAVRAQVETLREAFDDLTATVEDVVAEGDSVAMRVTLSGTHVGPVMGIEPTGRSFGIGNLVFARMEDGRIVERWVQPDMLGLLGQLGVERLPEAPAQ